MAKRTKRKKHKANKKQPKPALRQSSSLKWFVRFWKTICIVSVVLGLIVSLLSLIPNISVSTSQSLDPNDPLATPFIITNHGLLPIHSIEIRCLFNKVATVDNVQVMGIELGYVKPPLPILYKYEQKTFWCPKGIKFRTPINFGDISIIVSYRPDWLMWRQIKLHRFETVRNKSGILFWYSKPLSE
jgi:hypothetical protein